jgi:carbon monoxide dehydrogenase subunit G
MMGSIHLAAEEALSVDVQDAAGSGYKIVASFDVAAPLETVWSVLTDYEGIARFVSSIQASTVRQREGGRVLLEQRGVGRAWIVSLPMHVVLDVREHDQRLLTFRDVCGKSFSTYEGRWELTETPAGARVTYRLNADPNGRQPALVARSVLRSGVKKLMRELRTEIESRSAGRTPGS